MLTTPCFLLKFTINSFRNRKVHAIDIQIDENHTNIINQHNAQSTHYHSQRPWHIKIA